MAFFDKLGDFAKNIGDKTNEALEASRLNGKVNALKAAIAEEHRKLGEHFYQRYINGETLDPECAEVCSALDEKNREMDALLKEIEELRAKKEAEAQASQSAPVQAAAGVVCPECNAENTAGTKFCCQCGGRLPELASEGNSCPICGAENADHVRFCSQCGEKLQAAETVKRFCQGCGAELGEGVRFCSSCGAKNE